MSLKYGIKIKFDDDVRELAKQFPKAASAVLNRGTTQAQTQVVNQLFSEVNLPKKQIKKKVFVKKATANTLTSSIIVSQRGINPFWFLKDKDNPTTRREPVLLEIKRGSSTFVGNKFFANIGRKSGKLKVMTQPNPKDRTKLSLMPFIKGSNIFKTNPITNTIQKFIIPYLEKELPRVIEAWYRSGKDLR